MKAVQPSIQENISFTSMIKTSVLGLLMCLWMSAAQATPIHWQWTNPTPNGDELSEVIYGNGLYVAVGAGTIKTSPDGIVWTDWNVGMNANLQGVAWSGTKFVAVGSDKNDFPVAYTSPGGVNWTERSTGITEIGGLSSVTWGNVGGGKFVAVGTMNAGVNMDKPFVLTSSDGGLTWVRQPINIFLSIPELLSVTWSGTQFVAVGIAMPGGETIILTSGNGINWTQQSLPFPNYNILRDVTWGNNEFVAVGNGSASWGGSGIITSTNGINWIHSNPVTGWPVSVTPNNYYIHSVSWNGSRYVAVGFVDDDVANQVQNPIRRPLVLTSTDGTNWAYVDLNIAPNSTGLTRGHLKSVVWSATNNEFVTIGLNGERLKSPDGLTWSLHSHAITTTTHFKHVAWSNALSLFVAIGEEYEGAAYTKYRPKVFTSPDGLAWTAQTLPVSVGTLNSVAWGNGKFVIVGESWSQHTRIVLTSVDGVTWTQHSIGATGALKEVIWTGSHFFAVGYDVTPSYYVYPNTLNSLFLMSTDGINWTTPYGYSPLVSFSGVSLNSVTWNSAAQQLVVAGYNPTAGAFSAIGDFIPANPFAGPAMMEDTVNWAPSTGLTGVYQQLRSVVWSSVANQYVAVGGDSDPVIVTSSNGSHWTAQPLPAGIGGGLHRVVWKNNQFVVLGLSGWGSVGATHTVSGGLSSLMLTSSDGITWNLETRKVVRPLYGIVSDGTQLIGVGDNGTLVRSASNAVVTLPGANGMVTLTVPANESVFDVSASVPATNVAGITFPFGSIAYSASSPVGGSVTTTLTFSSLLPAMPFNLYKTDGTGGVTLLPNSVTAPPSNRWTVVSANAIEITLVDGGVFDLDGVANGVIVDPIAIGVTVDNVAPTFPVPPVNIVGVEAIVATGAVVNYALPAANDNVGTPTVVCTPASGSTFALGSSIVTCIADDGNGNTASVGFNVTVQDSTVPVLTLPVDVSAEAVGLTTGVITGVATATDIFPVTVSNDAPAFYPLGTTVVTWTVMDANGNTATATQTVTVVDTTVPIVTASLVPFSQGDDGDSDSDEGRFIVQFNSVDGIDPSPALTAELIIEGHATPITVTNGQLIEFEYEDEKTEVEMEDVLEIEAPSMILRVTATDASGNSAVIEVQPQGLAGDNDDESPDSPHDD